MAKTPFRPKMKTLSDKLWATTRQIVFKTHGTDCYTCSQRDLQGHNLQCGHGYPDGALGVQMSFDLRILRPQCFQCNINHGGMGAVFWKNLERDLGKKAADTLYLECQSSKAKTTNARDYYNDMIPRYKQQLSELV